LSGGSARFGPYWLDARVAVGGTAEVYLAHPVDPAVLPRRLIVKRLLPQFVQDPEGRTMFEREATLHTQVHHDNVVTVFGSGVSDDGEPYLAMEYVEGADLYRLLRRLGQEGQRLPVHVAVYIGREVLRALSSVHSARDATGSPLGIIHRDVTPSNMYLSHEGRVKLGDFGIARATNKMTMRNAQSAMIKGKFAYLAPEQVASEPFDHRADLFSLAVVMAEMLLGKPLFAGTGQLAVLLAIRDCRIDALREARNTFPPGLTEALERALSRDPAARYPSATAFGAGLAVHDRDPVSSKHELGILVRHVQSNPSMESMVASRDSMPRSSGNEPKKANTPVPPSDPSADRKTGEYTQIPSRARTERGEEFGPWPFARLIEAIATGQLGRGDLVDYMGGGMLPIEEIEDLARFLPPKTSTTRQMPGLGTPDFVDDISPFALLQVLFRVIEGSETGALFSEGSTEHGEGGRKEIYFKRGKLHHIASSNANELLGKFLVRRGQISREELDFALAVLPRYAGRMGDTLISLGLVNAVDIFRAIREQGRDRLTDLFAWTHGRLTYYLSPSAPSVEFPLDLDLPPLLLAGLEVAQPNDTPLLAFRPHLDAVLGPATPPRPRLRNIAWPRVMMRTLEAASEPRALREVVAVVTRGAEFPANDVLRTVQILVAARLLAWL
jgi:serine/threonine-protein kinase